MDPQQNSYFQPNQIWVNNKPYVQRLSPNIGPYMYCTGKVSGPNPTGSNPKHALFMPTSAIMYPTTHSIPGPFLQSYIKMPRYKCYPY